MDNEPASIQIVTDRLILKATNATILARELAFLRDDNELAGFAKALGATIETWPPLYHDDISCAWGLERITANPDQLGWGSWHVLLKRSGKLPLLVASAGFHGPPDATGNAEIGYSVIESQQRQGIATEVVAALVGWGFSHDGVTKLTITTLDKPALVPSGKVARRNHFELAGTKESPDGTILIYELPRAKYFKTLANSLESATKKG
jgi:RimJ/RimL family protein N-acetyltransferase